MSEILRTPDERFDVLPGCPWEPRYLDDLAGFEGLRMATLDVGDASAAGEDIYLCLHGQPAWGYLYRKMIPVFEAAGGRVLVPDLYGFGRSDKPVDEATYTFDFHRRSLIAFVEREGLENATLVVHDWGGILGLTLPMDLPGRFSRLIVMNTALAGGDLPLGKGFLEWKAWVAANPDLDVARLMARACSLLSPEEAAAYGAPYPDASYKAGVRRFPELVPAAPDDPGAELSRRAREWWKTEWSGRSFMAVGMADPVLGPRAMAYVRSFIRGCPDPLEIADGGHFVPEHGELVARRALETFAGA